MRLAAQWHIHRSSVREEPAAFGRTSLSCSYTASSAQATVHLPTSLFSKIHSLPLRSLYTWLSLFLSIPHDPPLLPTSNYTHLSLLLLSCSDNCTCFLLQRSRTAVKMNKVVREYLNARRLQRDSLQVGSMPLADQVLALSKQESKI